MLLATLALLTATATPAPAPTVVPTPTIVATPTPAPVAQPTPVGSPPPDAASKAITAQYIVACTAILTPTPNNIKMLFATIAPEFTNTDTTGSVLDRDKYLAQVEKELPTLHTNDCTNTFTYMVETDPNTIVVLNTADVKGSIPSPDGNHDIDFVGKSRDTWKLENGTWLEAQSTDIHTTVRVDGSVMQDSGS